jgi:endonuclease/exonuclease/phosphatase family metal-dependent hydrolase
MAALGAMYGGWVVVVYFLWKDRDKRLYWGFLAGMWGLSWGFTYRLWPFSEKKPPPSPTLRIATWNMDASHYDRKLIERDLAFLAEVRADVVCLQEVYLGDYSAECFAERAGYPYILFRKAGPAMGMAILSRYPVTDYGASILLRGSTNGVLAGKVALPSGDTVQVVNVHYPSYRLGKAESWKYRHWHRVWEAQREIDSLLARIREAWQRPMWVCGDFNAIPLSYAAGQWWGYLWDSYGAAGWLEGPTWRPIPLRIDYIWGPSPAYRQTTRWVEGHHHAYLLAEYGERSLTPVKRKSLTFALLGR